MTQGRRIAWPEGIGARGDYMQHASGTWYAMTPNGYLANLAAHDVIEHEDGTITVSPSILVRNHDGEQWHGFLDRGVWRAC